MPFAKTKTENVSIYFESIGTGHPIIFIHPPAMGHVTFKKQHALSKYFRVITLDLRGHGLSDKLRYPFVFSDFSADILAVINHLKLGKVTIVGYSNGGSISLQFALQHPDRVHSLVLCGGFSEVNSFLLKSEFQLGILTAKWKQMKLLAKVLAKSHTPDKQFQKELEHHVLYTDPHALSEIYQHGLLYDCTSQLEKIKIPVCLVYGANDKYILHYKENFIRSLSSIEVVFISKARHQVPTKHFLEFNKVIELFVKKNITSR